MLKNVINLRQFISLLRKEGEIVDIEYPVDPYLEIAEIHRRVAAADGPALFFRHVKGSSFPVVTNLFGSIKRIELAFAHRPDLFIKDLIHFATQDFPPTFPKLWKKRSLLKRLLHIGTRTNNRGAVAECLSKTPDLTKLPLLTSWPLDGGPFITLPLVYTEPLIKGPPNLGMYRIQRYNQNETGLHFQIAKGGGLHYHQAEKLNQKLPVNIFLGGPPALILSAILPLPENVSELLLCSLLQGEKLSLSSSPLNHYPLISECEFALLGEAPPHVRVPEGPFGDHYGYYSLKHDFPLFQCKMLLHRKDAIYPATVVGKPRQEDYYIGEYLQKLLSPLFPIVMPGVRSLWSYGETGFHSLGAAVVYERYYRECMTSAFRILGEGQLALTKFLLVTDQLIDLNNIKRVLTTLLERFRPETDLFLFANLSLDTLDYTGPKLNQGSRGILLGVGEKIRDLPEEFIGPLPAPFKEAALFCPGCLVLEGPAYTHYEDLSPHLSHPSFAPFPLLILVDNLKQTLKSDASFLWTTFTRFEPAADLHARIASTQRHHLSYTGPLLIDARMKPSYPAVVEADPSTLKLVDARWKSYFPQGMAMGSSHEAHL